MSYTKTWLIIGPCGRIAGHVEDETLLSRQSLTHLSLLKPSSEEHARNAVKRCLKQKRQEKGKAEVLSESELYTQK